MLLTLIKNELIKLLKRGKTWVVSILFVVLIVLIAVSMKSEENYMKQYDSYEGQYNSIVNEMNYYEELVKEAQQDGRTVEAENYQSTIDRYKQDLEALEESKNNPKSWKEAFEEEKASLIENIQADPHSTEINYYNQRIEEIDAYLEADIEPVEAWEFNAVNFGTSFISIIGMIILISGIAIFMSDIVSGECTPPTLKFLLVQPISRGKVLLSKFISVVIATITLIGGLELAAFGIIGAATGFDSAKMPTLVGVEYEWNDSEVAYGGTPYLSPVDSTGEFISQGEALLRSFGLQMLFIISCCAFVFLISCIFKSSMVTMAISVVSTIAVTVLSTASSTVAKVAHLFFLSYSYPGELLSGDLCTMFNNNNMTLMTGIIVMTVSTIVFYIVGHIVFNKKDILI